MKECTICHATKPLAAFNRDAQRADGLRPQCRECANARERARWRAANPEPSPEELARIRSEGTKRAWREHPTFRRDRIAAITGRPLSDEHRAKLSAARQAQSGEIAERQRQRFAAMTDEERGAVVAPARRRMAEMSRLHQTTSIESAVIAVLEALGIEFVHQARLGRYRVDLLIPGRKLVIECDGEYWHSISANTERDQRRDRDLTALGYTVLRLAEKDIKRDAAALVRAALQVA